FPAYGRLSGKNLEELLAGARVEVDERKRDPRDFAMWKAAKPGEPSWPSPWGAGRPGWHIECSAMSMEYLGPTFDIHGGGEDLIFPHHECEIAQSEAATGRTFARYWIHNGFVNLGAEKMSKSLGNTLLIRELVKRHDPEALRLWLLGTHYRSGVEFAEERLTEAMSALQRLRNVIVLARTRAFDGDIAMEEPPKRWTAVSRTTEFVQRIRSDEFRSEASDITAAFVSAMDSDFNTPHALGALLHLAAAANRQSDRLHAWLRAGERGQRAQHALGDFIYGARILWELGRTLGLLYERVDVARRNRRDQPQIDELVKRRDEARKRRDWAEADALRTRLWDL